MKTATDITEELAASFPGPGEAAVSFIDSHTGEHYGGYGLDRMASWIETHRPQADEDLVDAALTAMGNADSGASHDKVADALAALDIAVD